MGESSDRLLLDSTQKEFVNGKTFIYLELVTKTLKAIKLKIRKQKDLKSHFYLVKWFSKIIPTTLIVSGISTFLTVLNKTKVVVKIKYPLTIWKISEKALAIVLETYF